MDFNIAGELSQIYTSYQMMPVFEFAALFFVVIITYLGVHNLFGRWHQLTKFSLAVCLGSVGYVAGKIALIALFIQPLFAPTTANVIF